MKRRRFLKAAGGFVGVCLSGCLGEGGGDGSKDGKAVVEAGPPEDEFGFVPQEVTVEAGETVEWVARSARHNVVCDPDDTSEAVLPEGAEPFKSYEEGENVNRPIPQGERYSHTFETTGEYVYVCVPHLRQDMVGSVMVV